MLQGLKGLGVPIIITSACTVHTFAWFALKETIYVLADAVTSRFWLTNIRPSAEVSLWVLCFSGFFRACLKKITVKASDNNGSSFLAYEVIKKRKSIVTETQVQHNQRWTINHDTWVWVEISSGKLEMKAVLLHQCWFIKEIRLMPSRRSYLHSSDKCCRGADVKGIVPALCLVAQVLKMATQCYYQWDSEYFVQDVLVECVGSWPRVVFWVGVTLDIKQNAYYW